MVMAKSKVLQDVESAKADAAEARAAADELKASVEEEDKIPSDKSLKRRYKDIPGMDKEYDGINGADLRADFYRNGQMVGDALGIKNFDKEWSEIMHSTASKDERSDKDHVTKKFEKAMKRLEKKDPEKYAEVQEALGQMTSTMDAFDSKGKQKYATTSKTLQDVQAGEGQKTGVAQVASGLMNKAGTVAKTAVMVKAVDAVKSTASNLLSHDDKVAAAENLSSGIDGVSQVSNEFEK